MPEILSEAKVHKLAVPVRLYSALDVPQIVLLACFQIEGPNVPRLSGTVGLSRRRATSLVSRLAPLPSQKKVLGVGCSLFHLYHRHVLYSFSKGHPPILPTHAKIKKEC